MLFNYSLIIQKTLNYIIKSAKIHYIKEPTWPGGILIVVDYEEDEFLIRVILQPRIELTVEFY